MAPDLNATIAKVIQDAREALQKEDEVRVRVGLFGQPGAGKSSLINALLGQELAKVGVENDTTTEAKSYEWNGVTLVDLPGYDTKRFPADTYISRFDILDFDLLLCVFDGKFHAADEDLFREIHSNGKIVLFVRTKRDALRQPGMTVGELEQKVIDNVATRIGTAQTVVFVSSLDRTGLDALEQAISRRLDPAKRNRWVLAAKAYTDKWLAEKNAVCQRRVVKASLLAGVGGAGSALVPVPGSNLAIDVPIFLNLFDFIRKTYGLTDIDSLVKRATPMIAPFVQNVIRFAAKDAIPAFVAQFAGKTVAETTIGKLVPFVGPAIGGVVGYGAMYWAGKSYLADCHTVAEAILREDLGTRSRAVEVLALNAVSATTTDSPRR